MNRTVLTETRSQQALQSYLDGLLRDAAIELADSVSQDEFKAAVLEQQLRDIRQSQPPRLEIVPSAPPVAVAETVPSPLVVAEAVAAPAAPEPVVEVLVAPPPASEPLEVPAQAHPGWG